MPPNKNKGGGGRTKKGKGKAAIGREARASANTNYNGPGTFSESDLQNLTSKRILPTFHHNDDKRRKTNTGGFVKGGYNLQRVDCSILGLDEANVTIEQDDQR